MVSSSDTQNTRCIVCKENSLSEKVQDSSHFGQVTLGAKRLECSNCGFTCVNGSQMKHNATCEVVEICGPYKPILIESSHQASVYFDWVWKDRGFGQLSFSYDKQIGKFICMNEALDREAVRQLLYALSDHIADNAILDIDSSEDAT